MTTQYPAQGSLGGKMHAPPQANRGNRAAHLVLPQQPAPGSSSFAIVAPEDALLENEQGVGNMKRTR